MFIDCVYGVVYTFILIVYMGGIYMFIYCVYGLVYTCLSEARTLIYSTICHKVGIYMYILMVYMGGIYMYIDCVFMVVYICLFEARTLIYTDICHGLFCVQLFQVRNYRLCYDC